MRHARAGIALVVSFPIFSTAPAVGDIVCPDSSYCAVSYSCNYSGLYRPGQPRDYVTENPGGTGETFAAAGITFRVYLKNCNGVPIAGVAREQIRIASPNLCICAGGGIADTRTDANGCATFVGSPTVGGCATGLQVLADGVSLGTVPINISSPDRRGHTPCSVDGEDYYSWASHLGSKVGDSQYNICDDWNQDGVIDLSDYAVWAFAYHVHCP